MNSKKLQSDLLKFTQRFLNKRNMARIAKEGAKIIKTRTRIAGRDVNDRPLLPLEEETVRRKRKQGRRSPKKSRLTDSKVMLDSLKTRAERGESTVFLDPSQVAKAIGNETLRLKDGAPKFRVFFGLSPSDKIKLEIFIRLLYRKIGGL